MEPLDYARPEEVPAVFGSRLEPVALVFAVLSFAVVVGLLILQRAPYVLLVSPVLSVGALVLLKMDKRGEAKRTGVRRVVWVLVVGYWVIAMGGFCLLIRGVMMHPLVD